MNPTPQLIGDTLARLDVFYNSRAKVDVGFEHSHDGHITVTLYDLDGDELSSRKYRLEDDDQ